MAAYLPYNNNNIEQYQELHTQHNQSIIKALDTFKYTNNLTSEDFYITGSSCASYMNYFIPKHYRDIDIILKNGIDKKSLTLTPGIDLISTDFIPEKYRHSLIYKDGYYFCAAEDLLIHATMKAICSLKINSIEYMGVLLKYLNWTVSDYKHIFEKIIEESTYFSPEGKNKIKEKIWLLNKWHGAIKKQ